MNGDMKSIKNGKIIVEKLGPIEVKIRDDSYIFASDLCKAGGKLLSDYNRLESSKKFLTKLGTELGLNSATLVQSIRSGKNDSRGTWVHPRVAVHLAQWISPDFSVYISKITSKYVNHSEANKQEFLHELKNIKPSKKQQPEYDVQQKLKDVLACEDEVNIPEGKIDLMTDDEIIEIKEASNWKHAVGQILIYGLNYPNKQKVIYLFGECNMKELIIKDCATFGIVVRFYQDN